MKNYRSIWLIFHLSKFFASFDIDDNTKLDDFQSSVRSEFRGGTAQLKEK